MKCPKCNNKENFTFKVLKTEYVEYSGKVEYSKNGKIDWFDVCDEDDHEVEDTIMESENYCKCYECNYKGIVKEFDDGQLPFTTKSRNFDAAKWSRDDIVYSFNDHFPEYTPTEEDVDYIIEVLHDRFDASIGINWDVIEVAVKDFMEEK